MKPPENTKYVLFGGTFILAIKLHLVGDKMVDGLTTKQWFLLLKLMELPKEPAPTLTQLAQAMDSSRQNIAKMLEIMEHAGIVTVEHSKADQRSRSISVTPLGRSRAEETERNGQNFLNRLFEGISEEERAVAAKVTINMIQNLERMQEEL